MRETTEPLIKVVPAELSSYTQPFVRKMGSAVKLRRVSVANSWAREEQQEQ